MKIKWLPVLLVTGFCLFNVFLYWLGHHEVTQHVVQHVQTTVQHAPVVHKAAPVVKHLPEIKQYVPTCTWGSSGTAC